MNFIFLPTLQHLAAVKIALSVYYDEIIRFQSSADYVGPSKDSSCRTKYITKWMSIQEEASSKLSNLLFPDSLKKRVVQLIQPMSSEVKMWSDNHFFLMTHVRNEFANNLCWKSEGTIDRIKTAKQFIQNEKIDVGVRFVLACFYFWEFEISNLWREMSEVERNNIYPETDVAVQFWIERLKRKDKSPWTQAIFEYMKNESDEAIVTSVLTSSSYYAALNRETRGNYIKETSTAVAYVDDIRFFIYQVDEIERRYILLHMTAAVLNCYLRWPLQSLFLNLVNSLLDQQNPFYGRCLVKILDDIERKYIMEDIQGFNYRKLHKDLSNIIAKSFPEYGLLYDSDIE